MISRSLRAWGVLAIVSVGTSLASDVWIVRQEGVGPIRIGMSVSQLNTVLHEKFAMPEKKDDQGCFYVHPTVSLMIEDGRPVRMNVDKAGVLTLEGVQVGDSEKHVLQVYGPSLKVEERACTPEGHYLTVRSKDGRFGIRFETEKDKVQTFCAGRFEAVQYIEGCQ